MRWIRPKILAAIAALLILVGTNLLMWEMPERCTIPAKSASIVDSYIATQQTIEEIKKSTDKIGVLFNADYVLVSTANQEYTAIYPVAQWQSGEIVPSRSRYLISDVLKRTVYDALLSQSSYIATLEDLPLSPWKLVLQTIGIQQIAMYRIFPNPRKGIVAIAWNDVQAERAGRLNYEDSRPLRNLRQAISEFAFRNARR